MFQPSPHSNTPRPETGPLRATQRHRCIPSYRPLHRSWLHGALSGPPKRPHRRRPLALTRLPRNPEKPATVRIRLHGTPPVIAATLAALRQVLTIQAESRPYPDWPPSALTRIYLDATLRQPGEESQ
jgi:hypothetical protein